MKVLMVSVAPVGKAITGSAVTSLQGKGLFNCLFYQLAVICKSCIGLFMTYLTESIRILRQYSPPTDINDDNYKLMKRLFAKT